jgi:L-malate glycosyltransferase
MRIAFVSLMSGLPWGGSETLWYETALQARECGDSVLVSVYDWGKLHPKVNKLKSAGCIIHLRERYQSKRSLFAKTLYSLKNRVGGLSRFYSQILAFKPECIIISQGDSFDLAVHHSEFYNMISKVNIPYILLCHNHSQYGEIPSTRIFPGAINVFKRAAKVLFVSKRMLQITERKLCTKLNNATLTWNPLNLNNTGLISFPAQSTLNLAIVGSVGASKGHDTLFEVLSEARWKSRDWHLNVYGEGYGIPYLQELALFLKIKDKITFHGHTNEIRNVWKCNHILLIPSAGEGLPISLVEAMVCGRPAVVTDVGGNTEIVTEGVTGFIADAPTVSSFSNAMDRAWMQKELWKQMGEKAHRTVLERVDLKPEVSFYSRIKEYE